MVNTLVQNKKKIDFFLRSFSRAPQDHLTLFFILIHSDKFGKVLVLVTDQYERSMLETQKKIPINYLGYKKCKFYHFGGFDL